MAVVKKNFRVSKLEGDVSSNSMSSDEGEAMRKNSASESDEEYGGEDEDDVDSGMESDDADVTELGEIGEELCQVGNQVCSVPLELYDLPDLSDIFSVDVWNNLLTEEERFGLAEYLPDMDQEVFMRTLKELFTGGNLHFGSPVVKLFDMLKGGMCEPRVSLYRQGFNFFQKRRHYHLLQKYQDYMVVNLLQIKDAWANCKGYSIQEKLRVLNLMKSQKNLMYEKMEDIGLESDSSGKEGLGEEFWINRSKETARGLKADRQGMYKLSPPGDASSRGRVVNPESIKYGKQNPKGMLRIAGTKPPSEKDLSSRLPSSHQDLEMKARSYTAGPTSAPQKLHIRHDAGSTPQGSVTKIGLVRAGKDHFIGVPTSVSYDALNSHVKGRNVNQVATMAEKHDGDSLDYYSRDTGKRAKHPDKVQFPKVDKMKGRGQHVLMKGNPTEWSSANHHFQHSKTKEEQVDDPDKFEEWDSRGKKWKMRPEIGKNVTGHDPRVKSHRPYMLEMNDTLFPSTERSKMSQKKIKRENEQNGMNVEELRSVSQFSHSDETESESSDHLYSEEDTNPVRSKWGYPSGVLEGHQFSVPAPDSQQLARRSLDGNMYSTKIFDNVLGERSHISDLGNYWFKGKHKGKMHDPHYLHSYATGVSEEVHKFAKNGHIPGVPAERMHGPLLMGHPVERKKKGKGDRFNASQSNYGHEYLGNDDDYGRSDMLEKRGQASEAHDRLERFNMSLSGCNSVTKKRKKTDTTFVDDPDDYNNLQYSPQQQFDDPSSFKKRGKRKLEVESGSLSTMANSENGLEDGDPETKPGKKPFILITPTVHTGFSFSIVHFLSAVRVAMTTTLADSNMGSLLEKKELQNGKHESVNGETPSHSQANTGISMSDHLGINNLPSVPVQEIVNRVRSNPMDPSILDTPEPLQDLVRGVLKIFSSKTAPLGAKGWKALVSYEKSTKSWLWIGPVSSVTSDFNSIEEETSPEAWGLPHKMLVKLVDSFANWLKNSQETLQQIGSLPAPPLSLMQPNLDERERFRDLRAQKSLTTITPSTEEVRSYFRREEILRYLVPDRAFSYTAADGGKSIVAPLRRCGGKPTSKARDHPILKPDRPPHVTILCLVRDAAARLPGSIGTRADVCTLIRDSQYIVEEVPDAQVNQVVSGALDRLHYERDPCVQFDGERKLWVYLHREREEEDFEDDGTSSTKKWKRPRKDAAEQSDQGTPNVAFHGSREKIPRGSRAAYELTNSDFNVEPSSMHAGERSDFIYSSLRLNGDGSSGQFVGSGQANLRPSHPMGWDVLGLSSTRENNMLCQENSTNENYDDETFNRDRPVGLVSASIS